MSMSKTMLATSFRSCRYIEVLTKPPANSYSTLDHGRATYLIYEGHQIVFVKDKDDKIGFYFLNSPQLRADLREFDDGMAKVEPMEFYAITKELRKRMSDVKWPGGRR
jgi:hypothetical protein